jgi:hypothetical protein
MTLLVAVEKIIHIHVDNRTPLSLVALLTKLLSQIMTKNVAANSTDTVNCFCGYKYTQSFTTVCTWVTPHYAHAHHSRYELPSKSGAQREKSEIIFHHMQCSTVHTESQTVARQPQ